MAKAIQKAIILNWRWPAWFSRGRLESAQGVAVAVKPPWASRAILVELLIITAWAVWASRPLLDFDPFTWPIGREFGSQIQAHHFWTHLKACGQCALWNGSINGGAPALGDVFSSTFYPFVAIPVLLWGVIIGTKVAIFLALWIAGLAQWRLAYVLGLGWVARLWSACLAIVGGHLIGRLEGAAVGIIVSTAACTLALVAAIELGLSGQRQATLSFALALAMAIIAGQGYLQLGLISWAPAFLFLLFDSNLKLRPVWREYLLAAGLGLLLASFFLVPVLHFLPNFAKSTDPSFASAQPLEYVPLNLLIRDLDFMGMNVLGKQPFPYMYNLYIGWVPVLLIVIGIRYARRRDYPQLLCLGSGIVLVFAVASGIPLRWLSQWFPTLTGFRFVALIAGLAVPAVLGLAAYGLDQVLRLAWWPQLALRLQSSESDRGILINLRWLLAVPLLWALQTAYDLSQNFLLTEDFRGVYRNVRALQTTDLQWVAAPFGEHFWVEPALAQGLKLSPVVWAWDWNNRLKPEPKLIANRDGPPPDTAEVSVLGDVPIYENNGRNYAYVVTPEEVIACQASGRGGELRVRCETDSEGALFVQENFWNGWRAWRDGEPIDLADGQWLSTRASTGNHEYLFRYQPWDVAVGLVLTLIGAVLVVVLRLKNGRLPQTVPQPALADQDSPPPDIR